MSRLAIRRIGMIVLAVLVTGCAAGRAFRRGEQLASAGDYDAAVAYYQEAVQREPEEAEYRIALERAMLAASQAHITLAREFEESGQLESSLFEWRQASEFDSSNRQAAERALELDRQIRQSLEASQPPPPIEALRDQARQAVTPPTLDPASREPLVLEFPNASLRDVLDFIGDATGINITYDMGFQDQPYGIHLEGVTLEQALQHILTANNLFFKVLDTRTIIVAPDTQVNRAKYDEQLIQTFYLSHADATELAATLNNVTRIPQQAVPPVIEANPTINTITIRATTTMAAIIEQVIRANDKPRAEIVLDVEILEVNRQRARSYGLDLSRFSIEGSFSPEQAPEDGGSAPFNLNTISQGVSTADFYLSVPSAIVRFLANDSSTRLIAKPQLRGSEGTTMTLNLGSEIPQLSTTYQPLAAGGAGTNPLVSYSLKQVGINLDIVPRVNYEGDIVLELTVESSSVGPDVNLAGTVLPSFNTRRVATSLRLRDGESNLLAGLLREEERDSIRGLPGLIDVPGIRTLFGANENSNQQTDIVMLITPRIIRSHQLRQEDLNPVFIGSQGNIGLTGPPPLITRGTGATGAAAPADTPAPFPAVPGGGATPEPNAPLAQPDATPGAAIPGLPVPAATLTRVLLTSSAPGLTVEEGPYPVLVSVDGAARIVTLSLSVSYDPATFQVRGVQEGSFMRQGGLNTLFTQQSDASSGRVDLNVTRMDDVSGASGSGAVAVLLFDPVASGATSLRVSGTATTPEGVLVPLTFEPLNLVVE